MGAQLPFIDEIGVGIDAPRDAVWDSLCAAVGRSFGGAATMRFAGLLGCADRQPSGQVDEPGATLVGFHVARSRRPQELALEGEHRFAQYALAFHIDDVGERSRLRAETRAAFPGWHGRTYRALVIGSGGHIVAVKRLLTAVKAAAERSA
jgi:hypothetical protein